MEFGAQYRSTGDKIAELQTISPLQPLESDIAQWRTQGSIFDQYIKSLWIGLRAEGKKLVEFGLPHTMARAMFDTPNFIPGIDKLCQCK
jgi:hypothetical protein